jgi:hypothetical protein
MATPAQILANRANSAKSTGPCSVAGKAASSRNALKLGISAKSRIIPGEDESALEELSAACYEHFQPVGPEEVLLVERIVMAHWTRRRMDRLEAEVFQTLIAQQDESQKNALGAAFIKDCEGPKALQKIFRRHAAAGLDAYRATQELLALQADRIDDHPAHPAQALPASLQHPSPRLEPARPATTPHGSAGLPPASVPKPETSTPNRNGFVFDKTTPPAWRL